MKINNDAQALLAQIREYQNKHLDLQKIKVKLMKIEVAESL